MKVINLVKLSLIDALMAVCLSIDTEPVNASAQSTASLTQQNHPLKRFRQNHRRHRKLRRWKRHHHRMGNTNNDKKVPPIKSEEKK